MEKEKIKKKLQKKNLLIEWVNVNEFENYFFSVFYHQKLHFGLRIYKWALHISIYIIHYTYHKLFDIYILYIVYVPCTYISIKYEWNRHTHFRLVALLKIQYQAIYDNGKIHITKCNANLWLYSEISLTTEYIYVLYILYIFSFSIYSCCYIGEIRFWVVCMV